MAIVLSLLGIVATAFVVYAIYRYGVIPAIRSLRKDAVFTGVWGHGRPEHQNSWAKFLLGAVSGSGSGADWESISRYPEVAIYNAAEVRRVVKVADSDEQAPGFCVRHGRGSKDAEHQRIVREVCGSSKSKERRRQTDRTRAVAGAELGYTSRAPRLNVRPLRRAGTSLRGSCASGCVLVSTSARRQHALSWAT